MSDKLNIARKIGYEHMNCHRHKDVDIINAYEDTCSELMGLLRECKELMEGNIKARNEGKIIYAPGSLYDRVKGCLGTPLDYDVKLPDPIIKPTVKVEV